MPTFLLISFRFLVKTKWVGPTSKVWFDTQCPKIKSIMYESSYNIEKCKSACLDTPGCTALNYKHGSVCNLKQCSATVPVPTFSWNGYEGYYLKTGKRHSNKIMIQNY